ncbi:MAG: adenylyltransferase/cytidyltransferase family protein [Candidatus Diapherotrites archaeon]|nr:adenylyltransferase/cytidyltransferase family protein [Candidatus Diapherotrites archaeon]
MDLRVLVFGTFDGLHAGHLVFLMQAKKLGNKLIVVLARDLTVVKLKKMKPLRSEKVRALFLKNLPFVDQVVLGKDFFKDKLKIVKEINPSIIALGYDQNVNMSDLKKELNLRSMFPKLVRLKPFKNKIFKTRKLRKILFQN